MGGDDGPPVSDSDIRQLIEADNPRALIEKAELIGKALASRECRLKTSQIRNVFGAVRRIEMSLQKGDGTQQLPRDTTRELLLLRPKLAYQVARHKGESRGVVVLEQVLRPAIDTVGEDRQRFQRFVDFFEAILAYHRFYGGEN